MLVACYLARFRTTGGVNGYLVVVPSGRKILTGTGGWTPPWSVFDRKFSVTLCLLIAVAVRNDKLCTPAMVHNYGNY